MVWPFFTQISGRNFLPELCGEVHPGAALSKLCVVPFALQNRALFEGEKRVKKCWEKGRKRGGQQRGQKGKKDAWKQVSGGFHCWWFGVFGARESRPHDRALSAPRHCLDALFNDRKKRRGASPQSTCRGKGNPGPEKPKTVTSKSVTWRCLAKVAQK